MNTTMGLLGCLAIIVGLALLLYANALLGAVDSKLWYLNEQSAYIREYRDGVGAIVWPAQNGLQPA